MRAVGSRLWPSVRLAFPDEGEGGNTISFPQEGRQNGFGPFLFAQEGGGQCQVITHYSTIKRQQPKFHFPEGQV